MNKKYSIHNKKETNKKNKSQIDKVYKKTKGMKLYLGAILGFLAVGMMIVFSPYVMGKSYDFETVKMNSAQNVTSSLNMYIDDMEINREDGLFKLVLRYQDDTGTKSLSNIKSDYRLNFITNKNNEGVETKIIQLSDEYTVIYYQNLPKNFGVISVTVHPRYIYPELEPSNDLKEKEIKFYAVDKDIKSNNKLEVESTSDLQKDNFKYQIKAIEKSIKDEKKSIEKMNLANEVVQKDIDKANQNLEFQTLDEQTDTKNEISSMQTTIENNKSSIEESENKIKQLEEKIKQLEKSASRFE
ncbi:TPA: hypothetical protein PW363_000849 [Enterococcus faecium]|jgi:hypothetical protein|uniref:hypothetical protein n=1 Tax=Enterococcus TaxID=1350 RepID=UPI00280FAAB2|nr:hypothetical protein [Enterococcus sp. E4-208]MDQ8407801.1 hypothetical protein [Enterococcus faecium]MEB4769903.1 hypothetical protein [Enterococcus sp. E4-208]HAP9549246.1 hypothetical protein [Enterococcus faecium]HAP9582980.1 hypothetical protein [Enterococcus faecium]HAR1121552.1 hypothetical protein [Enterococcus faecium]